MGQYYYYYVAMGLPVGQYYYYYVAVDLPVGQYYYYYIAMGLPVGQYYYYYYYVAVGTFSNEGMQLEMKVNGLNCVKGHSRGLPLQEVVHPH